MVKDIADQKSLTNKNVVIIIIFLLGLIVPATHFLSYQILAKQPIFNEREKNLLLNMVDKQHEKDLVRQKIDIEQKAFNESILDHLKTVNKELSELSYKIETNKLELRKSITELSNNTDKSLNIITNELDNHTSRSGIHFQ